MKYNEAMKIKNCNEKRIKIKHLMLFILVLSLGAAGCKRPAREDRAAKSSSVPASGGVQVRFKTFVYVDREGTGIEAFRLLIPAGWSFEGGIRWGLDNPGMPALASFSIRSPRGTEELEVFPNQPFFWTSNRMLLQMFPVGSRYFGNEVRPIVGSLEALKKIIIPRFRGNAKGLRLTKEQPMPDLAKSLGAGGGGRGRIAASADGAKIRIEYQGAGRIMDEEIYGVVESFSFPIQSMYGTVTNTNWTVDYLFSFKAEKGKLDASGKLFQTMVTSFKVNPRWFNKYNQVVEYLIKRQVQHIRSMGELSRMISQTSDHISDMMMQSYNQRQEVYDRVAENFSQNIRGVDQYYNPVEQKPVELPSGYRRAWSNSLGEYILSEQEDFDPNVGSSQTWHPMEKK